MHFCAGDDSPLIADSSTFSMPFKSLPSAAIISPGVSRTASPTTTSSAEISLTMPFLKTAARLFFCSCFIFSNAFSLPYSERVETIEEIRTAITMPAVSIQLILRMVKSRLIAIAISRTRTMGSFKFSKKRLTSPFFFFLVYIFSPNRSFDARACSSLNPLYKTPLPFVTI